MSILNQGGFLAPTFNPLALTSLVTPTVEYLVVGGGGGGGGYDSTVNRYGGGGGGAGGFLTATGYVINQGTTYTVTVGQGGTQGLSQGARGCAGGNSVFGTGAAVYTAATSGSITAYGGGGGGAGVTNTSGGSGGSGGGGGGGGSAGSGTSGQGYNGGSGTYSAGGGGAGGPGTANGAHGGMGGPPIVSNITGYPRPYAAGGGGTGKQCMYNGSGICSGSARGKRYGYWGFGGGNIGGCAAVNSANFAYITSKPASMPYQNTGSGGGGSIGVCIKGCSRNQSNGGMASPGAAGIVIIRYPQQYNPAANTTGSPYITYAAGYRIYTWINSGTITF